VETSDALRVEAIQMAAEKDVSLGKTLKACASLLNSVYFHSKKSLFGMQLPAVAVTNSNPSRYDKNGDTFAEMFPELFPFGTGSPTTERRRAVQLFLVNFSVLLIRIFFKF
jgi:hypothetical protein